MRGERAIVMFLVGCALLSGCYTGQMAPTQKATVQPSFAPITPLTPTRAPASTLRPTATPTRTLQPDVTVGEALVTEIVDGDTIRVRIGDQIISRALHRH